MNEYRGVLNKSASDSIKSVSDSEIYQEKLNLDFITCQKFHTDK